MKRVAWNLKWNINKNEQFIDTEDKYTNEVRIYLLKF